MASVWKRLQRVNKRAAKFQYTASYHRIDLETTAKWRPHKLSVVWTRRSRRVATEPMEWEPSLRDPLKGSVIFVAPENQTVAVTLFKDSRTNELEDKDWTFVLEDVSTTGKRRRLASAPINMRLYASVGCASRPLSVSLSPTSTKIVAVSLTLTLHTVLLREGRPDDEDMQSLASLLSVNNNSDIAVLEDLDEDDYALSDQSNKQVLDLRQQLEQLTSSLSGDATPASAPSLAFDTNATPTAVQTPATPKLTLELSIDEEDTRDRTHDPTTPGDTKSEVPKLEIKEKPTIQPLNRIPTLQTESNDSGLKNVVFKPRAITKFNLKPLELKTNLNNLCLDKGLDKVDTPDSGQINDVDKLIPGKLERDKTPVQDLLEWCRGVTEDYPQFKVTDLAYSWRSGLAFCALIHHYRPHLIDFSGLNPENYEENLRTAFEASKQLGIAPLISVQDVCSTRPPDRLAIMTYLFQMRAHFTGSELQVEQLGNNDEESSYLVGRHDTDERLPPELFSREIVTRRSRNFQRPPPGKQSSVESTGSCEEPLSPVKDILTPIGHVIDKVLSPIRERNSQERTTKWFTDPLEVTSNIGTVSEPPPKPVRLMSRKELTDPFGSDDEDENQQTANNVNGINAESKSESQKLADKLVKSPTTPKSPTQEISSPVELPKPTPQLLSRHDELKERARQLLEATKREAREKDRNKRQSSKEKDENVSSNGAVTNGDLSPKKPMTEEERQVMLRERARKLIADARAGIVSPTSPLSPRGRPTVEIISKQSVMEEIANAGLTEQLDSQHSSPLSRHSHSLSPERSEERNEDTRSVKSVESLGERKRSPLQSFSDLVERLTPDKDGITEIATGTYIAHEQEALEREQKAIDEKACALEKQLRRVMDQADNTEEEDRLMSQWFNLVNKKNALLRRQMQLNILEKEKDLSRRCELLARELRLSLAVDEWRKTSGQKRRERLLLQELLEAVNERDRLVQEMDEQEKAIAEDDEIERDLSQVEIQRKNNCILQ